jgi:hypothetical protein
MVDKTIQEQIVSESPNIEAYKLGLLELTKKLADKPVDVPAYQLAGITPQQEEAVKMAGLGVGSYQPYMTSANDAYAKAAEGYGGMPEYGLAGIGQAGQYGTAATQGASGFGNLASLYGMVGANTYDPNSVTSYMNPYQKNVTDSAIAEMNRQAQIQQLGVSSAATKAGAFGGSRFGVQQAELGRNLAEVQSKKIFEDYYNNYAQAQKASMDAWGQQQQRSQSAGNLLLGVGNSVANTNIAAGNMGLNAATQGGQLQGTSAAGIASLGTATAALGQQQSGLQQGDVSFLYNLGEKQQGMQQKELDASRQTQIQQMYEPYQRVSFLSDIYKGAPSSQQTISQTSAPSASIASQVAGLGTAGLAAYNLMGKNS